MSEIKFMEKPDWVSWEDIRKCIYSAHQKNKKKGFEMLNSRLSAEELADNLKSGRCFVALDGKKVIGTGSVFLLDKRKWWHHGKVVYYGYDAILPNYRGTDVYFGLNELKDRYVKESGVRVYQFYTAEHNKTVIKINLRYGFKLVQFNPSAKGANYYSVTMVKWEDGSPFPDWFLNIMFNVSKIICKLLWKPGYRWRFLPIN